MKAAASYLKALRNARDLTQDEVGRVIGVTGKTVYDWETGKEPRATNLAAYIKAVGGSPDDVMALLNAPGATDHDGEEAAESWLEYEKWAATAHESDSAADRAVRAAVEVLQSPELIQEIIRRAGVRYDPPATEKGRRPWFSRLQGPEQA